MRVFALLFVLGVAAVVAHTESALHGVTVVNLNHHHVDLNLTARIFALCGRGIAPDCIEDIPALFADLPPRLAECALVHGAAVAQWLEDVARSELLLCLADGARIEAVIFDAIASGGDVGLALLEHAEMFAAADTIIAKCLMPYKFHSPLPGAPSCIFPPCDGTVALDTCTHLAPEMIAAFQ